MTQTLYTSLAKYGPISIVAGILLWFLISELNAKLDKIIEMEVLHTTSTIEQKLILSDIRDELKTQNSFLIESVSKRTALEYRP